MEYIVIIIVALVASAFTFFSGFGLGTILTPAFALFFPVPVAVAATAVVHLLNNLFKIVLVGRQANLRVALKFAMPAAVAAIGGALLLNLFSSIPAISVYQIGTVVHSITPVKLVIGLLISWFSLFEILPNFKTVTFDPKYLPVGGILSGFFGGLSGNQGAFRSMFLLKAGLSKEEFIGTNVVAAVIVDVTRLTVYSTSFFTTNFLEINGMGNIIAAAVLAAFTGAYIGKRLVKKVEYRSIELIVGGMLMLIGIALASGLI